MDSRYNNPCFFVSLLLFLFFFFFFSIKTHISFAADTISAGESLTGNQTIISKDKNFALGFFTPGKSLNFYIGIWYNKISVEDKTIVWVANREKPIKDPTNAELRLLGNGTLVLIDQSQKIFIWSTNSTLYPLNSTEAVLGDDGNLVLRDGSKPSNVIWESFDNPTNTWLPGGKLSVNKRTKKRQLLTSWRNEEDPAPGIFSLEAEIDPTGSGQFFIQWNRSEKFWSTGDWNGQMFREVPEMRNNYIYNFSYISNDEESYFTYAIYNKSIVTRFVMDVSGQIKQLSWLEETNKWNLFWSQPRERCDVYARCGSSGLCNQIAMQACDCLPGFNPRFPESWSLGDTTGGCVREISLQCGGSSRFLLVPNTKIPRSSEPFRSSFSRFEECQSACSSLCYCNGYAYGSSECLLWGGDLLNVQQVLDGNNTGGDLYLKLAPSEIQNAGGSTEKKKISIDEKKGGNKIIIITTVLIGIVIISICTYFTWRWMAKAKHRGRKKKNSNILLFDVDNTSRESSDPDMLGDKPELKIFSFKELIIATNNFSESNKLGQGGFGSVYKGELPDGQVIAIKRLSKSSGQGLQEFKNEVVVISKLQHRNLVRLLGCCIAKEEKILIYEYMPSNSLDTYLFGSDPTKRGLLDWGKRFQIIEGISRGILYLHRDSRLKVIHRDLKPSNVLLDEELNPKISDFGMARIFGSNELQANTNRVVGTYGYMSPEYAMEGQFSEKSDVFSFGVLLLEIVSGRRNTSFYNHDQSLSLLKHAWLLWNENKIQSLIEPTLLRQPHFELEIVRCIHVGLLCVQEFVSDRPTMSTTLLMLTSESATLPTPKQPAFTQRLPSSHSTSHEHKTVSVNTVTLTSVEGR